MEEKPMAAINLRDFYPWYTQDEFVEVSDEVAAAMAEAERLERNHARRTCYNKAHFSLDAEDGIEASAMAIIHMTDSPDAILEMKERHCRICQALNSLPEIQGRRIEARFMFGKSQAEIAADEGVTKGSVSISIARGLATMKNYFKNTDLVSNFCR
jgi:RNA polymerase sigma-70 factor (ECF subfamily)